VIQLPRWYHVPYTGGFDGLFPGHLPPLREAGELIGGLPVVAKGPSTYLARTESLRKVRYDENIRMLDHHDFFSSACGRMVFVQATEFVAFHARTPLNAAYMAHRNDIRKDKIYLGTKWRSRPRA
jgi:beta-1,4-N-acetylgalactosaminyltransferase 2